MSNNDASDKQEKQERKAEIRKIAIGVKQLVREIDERGDEAADYVLEKIIEHAPRVVAKAARRLGPGAEIALELLAGEED